MRRHMANDGAEPVRQSEQFRGTASEPDASLMADESVQALRARALAVLQQPALLEQADIGACASALSVAGMADEAYEGALNLVSAIVYWRPELIEESIVAGLET